jgi:hypothetical protein
MESLSWFGFNDLGHLGCTTLDVESALLFIGKLKHRISKFATLDGFKEVNQLRQGEESQWVARNHHTIISVIETAELKEVVELNIEFEYGGFLNYSYGDLYIDPPRDLDIITPTKKLLEMYGYYAPDEIISFCYNHRGKHYLPFVLGLHPEEITDELQRMLMHSEQLDNEIKE